MLELVGIVAAAGLLLGAVAVVREPKWLIPAVVIGLPIEYFGTETVGALGEDGLSGAFRALLNPGKAAMLATILLGAWRLRWMPHRLILDSSILLPALALLTLVAFGVLWSDSLKAPNQVLILPMYVAFLFVAPTLIESRKDVERILLAFLLTAIALSVLAIAQRVLGIFYWRDILIQADGFSYRSNATVADPNHLARILVVAVTLAAGAMLVRGPTRMTLYVALPTILVGLPAIVATASRSGWLMLGLCGLLTLLTIPIARGTRLRLLGASGALTVVLIVFLMFQGGADAERVQTLATGSEVLGLRQFLIQAGWAMFQDNPLFGVGAGGFQNALITTYRDYLPTWAETTLSHTSGISLLAELGIVGAAMFVFFLIRIAVTNVWTYIRATAREDRWIVSWIGVSVLGMILHSQSEGRLLDEPYLWVLLALLIAYETNFGRRIAWVPEAARERVRRPERARAPAPRPAPGPAISRGG